jgi:hypothetical protein
MLEEKISIKNPVRKAYVSKNHFGVPIGRLIIRIMYRNGLIYPENKI